MTRKRYSGLKVLRQMHGRMVVKGFNSDPTALEELLLSSVASAHGTADYAQKLFEQIPQPNLFMRNTMIKAAAHSSTPHHAVSLYYSRMVENNVKPDAFTFLFLLKASTNLNCSSASSLLGAQLHAIITKLGLDSDVFVRNSLICHHASRGDLDIANALFDSTSARSDLVARSALVAGYARRGRLGLARRLFDETGSKDMISWNVMISAYAKRGEMESARELFDRAPRRDVVSWNAVIAGYVRCGYHGKALEMYGEMVRAGETPDEATMLSLISSCTASTSLETGKKTHYWLLETYSKNGLSILHGNALIHMYAKCGSIERAMEVFREMRERDIWTWNSITGGLAIHGRTEECIDLFKAMERLEVKPNYITFVNLLAACSRGGKIDEGRRFFSRMTEEYGIAPNLKHYGCMVDMLGRAGLFKEAFELASTELVVANPVIWRMLLGACRIHGEVGLARVASERLLQMGQEKSGDYVLLSNLYSSAGEWNVAEVVRKSMDHRGVKKEAGCTLMKAVD